jgi:hypothetical protein
VFLITMKKLLDAELIIFDDNFYQSLPDLHHVGPQPLAGVVGVIGGGGGGGKIGIETEHGASRQTVNEADERDLLGDSVQL